MLQLRGRNLFWAMQRLLAQVDPSLAGHGRQIADVLLHHPALTHRKRSSALAVRKEEVVRLLTDLAKAPEGERWDPWYRRLLRNVVPDLLRKLLARLFPHPTHELDADARAALKRLLAVQVPGAKEAEVARVQAVAAALQDLLPSQTAAVTTVVDKMLAETNKLAAEVNAWFDTFMDRSSERFKLRMRYVTALVALVLALGLRVDALDLLRQLSSNETLRGSLVDLSQPALGQAGDVSKLDERRRNLASSVLEMLRQDPVHKDRLAGLPEAPKGYADQSDGLVWLKRQLGDSFTSEIAAAYEKKYLEANAALRKDQQKAAAAIWDLLDGAGLQVIPADLRNPFDLASWKADQFRGVMVSWLLLSLGAPFWFNVLRKLADLRPIVARRVEGEPPKAVR